MKFVIDLGHGCPPDTGAVGIRKEEDLINEVGKIVISRLKELDHEVIESRPKSITKIRESLIKRVETSNKHKPDLFVCIHFNASKGGVGKGTEVFAISQAGMKIAARVVNAIASIGFVNRGAKPGTKYYVLRNTTSVAILIECCFCDNKVDMDLYSAPLIADAIVKSITPVTPIKRSFPIAA